MLQIGCKNLEAIVYEMALAAIVVSFMALITGLFQGVGARFLHLVQEGAHYSLLIRSSVTNLLCTFPATVYR